MFELWFFDSKLFIYLFLQWGVIECLIKYVVLNNISLMIGHEFLLHKEIKFSKYVM